MWLCRNSGSKNVDQICFLYIICTSIYFVQLSACHVHIQLLSIFHKPRKQVNSITDNRSTLDLLILWNLLSLRGRYFKSAKKLEMWFRSVRSHQKSSKKRFVYWFIENYLCYLTIKINLPQKYENNRKKKNFWKYQMWNITINVFILLFSNNFVSHLFDSSNPNFDLICDSLFKKIEVSLRFENMKS